MSGRFIKSWRERNGITQVELSEILGVTQHRISLWETGKAKMSKFASIGMKALLVHYEETQVGKNG